MLTEILRRLTVPLIVILFFFLSLFIYTKIAGPIPFNVNSVITSKEDAFSVMGEGRVDVKPDSATIRLGVVARAASADEAKEALNTNINKVVESVKNLGVAEDKIKTENFNIYPEYGDVRPLPADLPASDQNRITGYNANSSLTITVDDAETANRVLDAGVGAGANQVGGVDFQVKNKDEALNRAREIAVKDAKKKAEDAARIAGFRLGNIINYSEGMGGGYPVPMMARTEDAKSGIGGDTDIQPGTNEVMVTVTLSYEIR